METSTFQFSQAQLVETIWEKRDIALFKKDNITKKSMLDMDVDTLTALADKYSIDLSSAPADEATASPDLSAVGVRAILTDSGTTIHVLDCEFIETNGVTFYFSYQDKKIMLHGDLDLSEVYENGSLKIGDKVPFHYHGANTWKPLSMGGALLVPNNKGDRAKEHSTSGTICKSAYEPIAALQHQAKEDKLRISQGLMKIAKEKGLDKQQIRQIRIRERAERADEAYELFKALKANS